MISHILRLTLSACALALLLSVAGCTGGSTPTNGLSSPAGSNLPPAAPNLSYASSGDDPPPWAGQRDDEPFDVKAFLAARTAPPDNGALLFLAGMEPICGCLSGKGNPRLEKRVKELANVEKLAADAIDLRQIDEVLIKAAPALAQVDAAQSRSKCVFITGLTADALMPHALAANTVSRLALLQLKQAQASGDFEHAENAIRRSLRLSRDVQLRGPLACQLVSFAIDGKVLRGIELLTLDSRLTVEQIDRLLELLNTHQKLTLNRAEEGLKVNYFISRNSLDDLRSGRLTIDQIGTLLSGSATESGKPSRSGPALFNYDVEIAGCNRMHSLAIAAAGKPFHSLDSLAEFRQEEDRIKQDIAKFKALVASTPAEEKGKLFDQSPSFTGLLWCAPVEVDIRVNCQAAAGLAGVELLLALRRYEIAHGVLPASLEMAAAETVLKTVPLDPYDGKPMRFALVDSKPTVYSVGKNRTDEGGQSDGNFGKQRGDYVFVLRPMAP